MFAIEHAPPALARGLDDSHVSVTNTSVPEIQVKVVGRDGLMPPLPEGPITLLEQSEPLSNLRKVVVVGGVIATLGLLAGSVVSFNQADSQSGVVSRYEARTEGVLPIASRMNFKDGSPK